MQINNDESGSRPSYCFFRILAELSLLFVDGEMSIILVCGERDSREKCLPVKMHVEVLVRNASLPSDVENKLNAVRLKTCILPADIQGLVGTYTAALQHSKFCRHFVAGRL